MAIKVLLREILRARGVKQVDLARELGVSYTHSSRIANHATSGIQYQVLSDICRTLDCQPGDILVYVPDDGAKAEGRS